MKANEPENLNEIRFLSKLLRSKIQTEQSSVTTTSTNINHNELIKSDFWKYAKRFIEKPKKILPTFNQIVCTEYFRKTLQSINPTKRFTIPSWLPAFKTPTYQYDITPPTYQEITKIIRRMKASGSPCPLDQISIIVFRRCPYLRSYLQLIFRKISCTGQIPSMWKKAVTILIHKKGEQNDPQNFRPITLETVPLKICTSFLRNRMYNFLNKNGYIESTIQKGFTPGMAGTFEHTYHMAYLINQARAKQRSIVIRLLDLKNAFGEVQRRSITPPHTTRNY